MLTLPCGPVHVETSFVLTYELMSSIFPENDWEEKDVNHMALAVLAAIRLKAARPDHKSAAACGDTDLTPASILMRSWRFSYRERRRIPIRWPHSKSFATRKT